MIHAYNYVTRGNIKEDQRHGPIFIREMTRVNKLAKSKITVRYNCSVYIVIIKVWMIIFFIKWQSFFNKLHSAWKFRDHFFPSTMAILKCITVVLKGILKFEKRNSNREVSTSNIQAKFRYFLKIGSYVGRQLKYRENFTLLANFIWLAWVWFFFLLTGLV